MNHRSKSIGNLSWALSLLGLEQLASFLGMGPSAEMPPAGQTSALERVTEAATEALSPSFRALQQAGERIWERIHSSLMGPSLGENLDSLWQNRPEDDAEGAAVENATVERGDPAAADPVEGWGPMPPIPDLESQSDRWHRAAKGREEKV